MEEEQHNDQSSDDAAGERQLDFFNNFPPGFRFNPYDEELILYYLNPKINGQVLPPNCMHEVNIYANHPSVITGCYPAQDGRWYFFTPREKMYPNGGRPKRSASNGKWKAISRTFDIIDKRYGILIGHKRILGYEEIDDSNEKTLNRKKKSKKTMSHEKKDDDSKPITTIWGMYEYWIHESSEILQLKKDSPSTRLDYVLCIIYKKENKGKGRKKSKDSPLVATDKKEGQLVLNDKPAENAAVGTTIEHPCTSLPIPSAFELGSTSSSTINLAENAAVGTIIGHPCTSLPIPSAFEVGSTSSSTINLAVDAAFGTIFGHPYTSLPIPLAFEVGSTSNLAEDAAVNTIFGHPYTSLPIPSAFEVGSTSNLAENGAVGTTVEHPCSSSSMPSTFEVGSTSNSTINEYPGHTSMPSTSEVGNTSSNNATYNFDDIIMMDLSWLNDFRG